MIALVVVAVLVVAGGVVAAVLLLTGEDGPEVSSERVSEEEFCQAFEEFDGEVDDDASEEEQVEQAHEAAETLAGIGTPEDMPDDAREGFELYVEAIADVEEGDLAALEEAGSEEELAEGLGLSGEDAEKMQEFFSYAIETCFLSGDAPSAEEPSAEEPSAEEPSAAAPTPSLPSGFPTDGLPSDFPSELLSEFPTELFSEFPTELFSDFPTDSSLPAE